MIRYTGKKIGTRLRIAIVLTSSLALILCCLGFMLYEYMTIRERMGNGLTSLGMVLGANCTAALSFENPEDAIRVLSAIEGRSQIMEAAIYDNQNRLFATYVTQGVTSAIPSMVFPDGWDYDDNSVHAWSPIALDGTRIGTIYLRANLDLIQQRFETYTAIAAMVLVLSFVASIIIASFVQNRISRPIVELAETAQTVTEKQDYSIRAKTGNEGEVGFLGAAFNKMLETIDQRNEELRKSEARYRTLFDLVPVPTYVCDPSGNILEYNEQVAQLWGREPHRISEMNPFTGSYRQYDPAGRLIPGSEDPVARVLSGVDSSGSEMEMVVERPDGSTSTVIKNAKPLKDADGKTYGAICCLYDISERKRWEETIRKANENLEERVRDRTKDLRILVDELQKRDFQLSAAEEIARLGSWEWNLRSQQISFSDEMLRIYGLRPDMESPTREAFFNIVHPEDRPAFMKHIEDALAKGMTFDCESRIVRADGSVKVIYTKGRSDFENGMAIRLIGTVVDVTERKHAQRQFRDLLESAQDPIVITNTRGLIVLVNRKTEQVFGYGRSDLLGRNIRVLIPGFPDMEKKDLLPNLIDIEMEGVRKIGTPLFVVISMSPLQMESGILLSVAIKDVTRQKELQARILANERERSVEMQRNAISMQRVQEEERRRIARDLHDGICQKLCGMKMMAEVIEDAARPVDKTIYQKSRGLARKCEDLIGDVRRVSANLRPAMLDDFGIVSALKGLARQFEKQQNIRVIFDSKVPEDLSLDTEMEIAMYRITQEALANIAKHAQASQAAISLQRNDGVAVLRISDNGNGFDKTQLGMRGDPEHGFGLRNMRERTELFGGTFSVASDQGKGTVISIAIPDSSEVKTTTDVSSQTG